MKKSKKAVLFGTSGQAEVMSYLLTIDSKYEIIAFTSTSDYIKSDNIYGKPLVPFEKIEEIYSPGEYEMHIAVGYNNRNKTRAKFYDLAKDKGYKLLTYVSSRCTNYSKKIGDNCFIFEDNTIQPFVEIGNNNILWSGNHIGHHSIIKNNVFVTSHVVISGHCLIGNNSFLGVNSTIRDGIKIADDTLVGAGSLILKDTSENKTYIGTRATEFPYKK